MRIDVKVIRNKDFNAVKWSSLNLVKTDKVLDALSGEFEEIDFSSFRKVVLINKNRKGGFELEIVEFKIIGETAEFFTGKGIHNGKEYNGKEYNRIISKIKINYIIYR